jgi:hypothetical protein
MNRDGAAFRKCLSRLPTSPTFSRRANRNRGWTMEFVRQTIEINGCKLMPYAQPYFTRWHAAPPRARWLEPEYRD